MITLIGQLIQIHQNREKKSTNLFWIFKQYITAQLCATEFHPTLTADAHELYLSISSILTFTISRSLCRLILILHSNLFFSWNLLDVDEIEHQLDVGCMCIQYYKTLGKFVIQVSGCCGMVAHDVFNTMVDLYELVKIRKTSLQDATKYSPTKFSVVLQKYGSLSKTSEQCCRMKEDALLRCLNKLCRLIQACQSSPNKSRKCQGMLYQDVWISFVDFEQRFRMLRSASLGSYIIHTTEIPNKS